MDPDSHQPRSRRPNSIVDLYVTSDLPLLTVIQKRGADDTPMTRALTMLCECLDGRRLAKEAIDATQAVPLSGADSELTLLMLSTWTELACRLGRPSEAQALLHQIRTLITDETHPVVLAYARRAEAILADTTGDKRQREAIMREILPLLQPHSPRRKFYIWELGLFLAQQGRASELRAEMKELTWQCNERFPLSRVKMVQFIDAVETGHIQIASQLMPELSASTDEERRSSFARYPEYQVLLGLVHAAVGDTLVGKKRTYHLPRRPVWAQIIYYLLIQDTTQALKLARMEARRQLGSLLDSGFGSLNLVRAELSSRNHDAATRLIAMRRTRGNIHYLDDFFLARAEFLAGNPKAAAEHFATALARADTYDARKRIDFELMLSVDLSQGDIVELTRRATSIQKRKRTPLDKAPSQGPLPPTDSRQRTPPNLQQQGVATIMGRSAPVRKVREEVLRFADLETPVLITGETGTGKELVARALHYESKRSVHTFTAINCGTIAETLLESELFGHEKGAFTGADRANRGLFEETGKGTILLDEIGEVSPRMQMALLRVMETGEIRAIGSSKTRRIECRVVAATNTDLSVAAADGSFRKDLMFRLQRLGIEMPPLRERKGDIMLLARRFLDAGRPIGTHCSLSRGLVEELREYDWPGNIRELRNVIERMRLMHSDKLTYSENDLDIKMRTPRERVSPSAPPPPHPSAGPHPTAITDGTQSRNDPIAELLRGGNSPLRRLERLRDLFTQYGELTRAEAIRIMGFSPNTATKYLKELTEEGFIKRVEPSASTRTHYFARVDSAIKRPVLRPASDKPL